MRLVGSGRRSFGVIRFTVKRVKKARLLAKTHYINDLRLTKLILGPIITVKSKPRTRLAPQRLAFILWQSHKTCRHLCGVAADFLSCCVFAFLEVSRTMIVTVYFPIWKVRRIRITSFRRDGTNRLRVCCLLFTAPFGDYYFTGKPCNSQHIP